MKRRNKYFWELILLAVSVMVFLTGILLSSKFVKNTSLDRQAAFFEKEIAKRVTGFEELLQDEQLMKRLTQSRESLNDLMNIYDSPFYFYVYKKDADKEFLRFWNTGIVIPSDQLLYSSKDEQVLKLPNGYYYSLRKPVPGYTDFNAYCLILIKSSFFIETEYFKNNFPFDKTMNNVMDVSLKPTPYAVKSTDGNPLFYLRYKANTKVARDSELSVVMKIIGLFLFFLALYFILAKRLASINYLNQIYFLAGSFLLFRALLYLMTAQWRTGDFSLFDPAVYSAGDILPSLGDLLINSLLFCWVSVFVWNRLSAVTLNVHKYNKKTVWVTGISCLVILIAATFSIAGVIKTLIAKSKISFDVTNVSSLSVFTAVGFIILACLCLGFYYLSRTLYKYILSVFKDNLLLIYLLIAVLGLLFITLIEKDEVVIFYLPVLVWLLVYTFVFTKEAVIYRYIQFSVSGTILWIFVFSVSLSLLMLKEINKAELSLRKKYIEKLATQTDPASERLISIANKYLDSNYFRNNFRRLYNQQENERMRDSIRNRNYIGYLNNYVTNLYFFDSLNNPLFNQAPYTVEALNNIIANKSRPTSLPDMYFYESEFDNFAYITRRVISNTKTGHLLGTIYIVSNPRKFAVANIRPELFKQFRSWEYSNSLVYQYATYQDNQLESSSKKYPFTSYLTPGQIPQRRFEIREKEGYDELWYRASASKVIVMVRKSELFLEAITLFSYIFCSFLFLTALINLLVIVLNAFISRRSVKNTTFFPTIRSQIHGTFILINVLAFLVVGAATISFFVNRFEESNNDKLSRTMNIMLNELNSHDSLRNILRAKGSEQDLFSANALNDVIKRVSDIHGVDVNIYDQTGVLRASSQPDIYSRGVLSDRMTPRAYYYLLRLRRVEYTQKERVSNLFYNTIYAPVGENSAQPYAYLSIPYFTSQQELSQEISTFLITLINLYAFIFLLTGLLALLITNRITGSFTVIGNKMKQISLSSANEDIIWERDDEIGQLVREYNKMVTQLKESADTLARSEREEAWREMARQVAHEIKNPLTPMKLSLQYLQKAINERSPNIQQLTSSVAKTLVEQIDHLSKIAADFSQFANINHVKAEAFDLHEVLQPLESIYSKNPEVTFNWNPLRMPVQVMADKTQLNRLFTNLFVNAIDACIGNAKCVLEVTERLDNDTIIISIKDNGSGISEAMQTKIFTPNFTTKSSGTGLGLAMCKGIVEKANGTIWFETEPGIGTTFFVKLPVL